jgi:N,N'-diacetyllegionaminate synthase
MTNFFDHLEKVFIIAEIGGNHNSNIYLAKELIEIAAQAGVDAVKFQTFVTERLITKDIPAFPRAQLLGYKTQFDRFKDLELNEDQLIALADHAKKNNVVFLSTPFDDRSVDILDPLVPSYKIASADIINFQLLRHVALKGKPVLLSTGQAVIEEIDEAVKIFAPDQLSLLHCISSYPTPDDQANLLSIPYLKERYRLPIGYSDHTLGVLACISAVALGARIIEKHFTLDKTQPFGDHPLSADPDDLRLLVGEVRRLEKMLGSKEKGCQTCEEFSKVNLRRSLHARVNISIEMVITSDMLIPLVSGKGIPANHIDNVIGKKAVRNICIEEAITDFNIK